MFCAKCGAPTQVSADFCMKCGARLDDSKVAPAVEVDTSPAPSHGGPSHKASLGGFATVIGIALIAWGGIKFFDGSSELIQQGGGTIAGLTNVVKNSWSEATVRAQSVQRLEEREAAVGPAFRTVCAEKQNLRVSLIDQGTMSLPGGGFNGRELPAFVLKTEYTCLNSAEGAKEPWVWFYAAAADEEFKVVRCIKEILANKNFGEAQAEILRDASQCNFKGQGRASSVPISSNSVAIAKTDVGTPLPPKTAFTSGKPVVASPITVEFAELKRVRVDISRNFEGNVSAIDYLANPSNAAPFRQLLGDRFEDFRERMQTATSLKVQDGYVSAFGLKAHHGGEEEAAFAFAVNKDSAWAGQLSVGIKYGGSRVVLHGVKDESELPEQISKQLGIVMK